MLISGLFNIINENYNEIKESFKEIINQLECLHSISIEDDNGNERNFRIIQTLCCDFKMLYALYGLNGPTSNFSCIFCKHDLKDDPYNYVDNETTAVLNYQPSDIDRSLLEAVDVIHKGYPINDMNSHKGYIQMPISHIDFNNCVPDTLHFLLRGSDKLFQVLLAYIFHKDGSNRSDNIENRPVLKKFRNFLTKDCEINDPFYFSGKTSMEEDSLKMGNINSNDLIKIYKKINSRSNMFSHRLLDDENDYKLQMINLLFNLFYKIYLFMTNKR